MVRLSLILFSHVEEEDNWPRGTDSERMRGRTSRVDEEGRCRKSISRGNWAGFKSANERLG